MKGLNKMKVLITGVAGLLGSRLADWLISNKISEVDGIDDLSGGYIENVHQNVSFNKINLAKETNELEHLFRDNQYDYVFHFAAYAAEGLSPFIRQYNYENNLIATTKLINKSIKYNVKRFIFTSTMAVYGNAEVPFKEHYIPNPIDPYGIAKYACEMDLKVAGDQHGLDWCIFRPHNVYGAKQNIWDKYRNVLGIWMYQLLNGDDLTIYGDGNQTRAFSYIDDCVPYFWMGATDKKASKEIFNIGGDDHITINDAADTLIKIAGKGNKKYLEQRHEVKHAWVSHDHIKEQLNYKQSTNLEDGLIKMWDWAQKQPKRERKLWQEYELESGIYDFWKIKK
jgi:UDP-glucose 4-epimerase